MDTGTGGSRKRKAYTMKVKLTAIIVIAHTTYRKFITLVWGQCWLASFSYAAIILAQRGCLSVGLSAFASITGKQGPKSKIGVDHLGTDYQVTLY